MNIRYTSFNLLSWKYVKKYTHNYKDIEVGKFIIRIPIHRLQIKCEGNLNNNDRLEGRIEEIEYKDNWFFKFLKLFGLKFIKQIHIRSGNIM